MDGRRFDNLARRMAGDAVGAAASRRGLLRWLGGGAVGVLLGYGVGEETTAACKTVGKSCQRKSDCCTGRCKNGTCKCSNAGGACDDHGQCCGPFGTLFCCGGVCTDTKTDPSNCGACGAPACPPEKDCANGQCCTRQGDACGETAECCFAGTLTTCCGGVCLDTSRDENNCGGCGTVCPSGDVCFNGECCLDIGAACLVADNRCCGNRQCKPTDQQGNGRCCLPRGAFCFSGAECCRGRCRRGVCRNR
jgi:hypothetical protein